MLAAALRMLDEDQRTTDVEPEPPATCGDHSQDLGLVHEAATQQNQPGLEVVLDIRQLEALVESNLAVRELDAMLVVVDPEQLPQDSSCYPFDQICIVHEDAVVRLVVFDR